MWFTDSDTHANSDSDAHSNGDSESNSDGNTESYPDTNGNGNSNCNVNSNADGYNYTKTFADGEAAPDASTAAVTLKAPGIDDREGLGLTKSMIGSQRPDPFGSSLLGSFPNLASIPRSILCCLILAFSFLRVTSSLVRPSFSPLFPASHSDFGLNATRG